MSWLTRVLGIENVAHQASERKALALMLPPYQQDQPLKVGSGFQSAVDEGWRRNELIYACMTKKAYALGSIDLDVEALSSDKELDNHPLTQLLDNPNPLWSQADFIMAISIYQDLAGVAYFEKVRSKAGKVVQLWPLRPDWTRPLLNNTGLAGWQYQPNGLNPVTLLPNDVLALRIFDPVNLYGGTSPVMVLGRSGDTDNAMTDFMKNFFESGALPQGILTTKQLLQEPEVERIRQRWGARYGGWKNWFEPAVIDSEVSYQRISMSFEDMGFEALDSRNEARICMVMGVPPIIVNANIGMERSTLNNYETARKAWWEDDLHPKAKHLRGQLERNLAPEFGGGIRLVLDLSEIPAFQDDQNEIQTNARENLKAGLILVDEARLAAGLDPLPNGLGQVFLRPANMIEVPLSQLGEPAKATTELAPPDTEPTVTDADAGVTAKALLAGVETKAKDDGTAPDDAVRRKYEAALEQQLTAYFGEFLGRFKKELA